MKNAVVKSAWLATTALAFGLGAPVCAQTAQTAPSSDARPRSVEGAAGEGSSADIIVTARRVEERLQDVPISITVFNQQQVTNRNLVNSTDLATYTPSLTANSNFGTENATFAIRGFTQDTGTSPSVGVYFADVVAPRGPTQGTQAGDGAGPGVFFDLQNVQILKGPQGTLQGRNTTGGAILFVPQKPTSKYEGFVEGSYGNYSLKRVQGALNIPLSDIARLRIAGDHQERDGYLRNTSGIGPDRFNAVDYTALRLSLVVDLTPDLENYTILSYSHSNTSGSVQKLIGCNSAGYDPVNPAAGFGNFVGVFSCAQLAREKAEGQKFYDVESAEPNPVSKITQWQAINTTTWHASDTITIKNIISYAQFVDLQRTPLFSTNWQISDLPSPYPFIFFRGIPRQFLSVNPAIGYKSANQSTFTEEFQIQGNALDSRLTYQGGVYLEISDPLGLVGAQSPVIATCTNIARYECSDQIGSAFTAAFAPVTGGAPIHVGALNYTVGKTSYRDVGLYSQATYKLTDKIGVTGGFRYTWDRTTNTSTRYGATFDVQPPYTAPPTFACTNPAQAPSCSGRIEQKSNKPTWLIDIDYKPTEDILVYAKYSRGYRTGGVYPNAPSDYQTFGPEKVDTYEGGLKTSFRGPISGTFNVAGFYNNFSNQQLALGFNPRVDPTTGATAPVSATNSIINAGKSRIYGAEVEATITPFRGFTIDGAYTYLNTSVRKVAPFSTTDPNYQANVAAITVGAPLVLSPRNKASITGSYTLPLPETVGRVTFAATFTHTDKQISNFDYYGDNGAATRAKLGANYGQLAARNLLNLNLNWNKVAGSPIDLAVFATNVTNKKYYTFVPGLDGSGAEFASLGEPRFFGGRIRYQFGR